MKYTYLLLLVAVAFLSCNKADERITEFCPDCEFTCLDDSDTDIITNQCEDATTCNFRIYPNQQLDVDESILRFKEKQSKQVLFLDVYSDPSQQIADDEVTILLGIELPTGQTSFSLTDQELTQLNVHFQRTCFCGSIPIVKVDAGCLQGEQQDDGSWWVQGNLNLDPEEVYLESLKFEVQFKK